MSGSSNSLPSLPTCTLDKIPLHYLTDEDRDRIAGFLDQNCAWKMVAEAAGLETWHILWISARINGRGSDTLTLLDDLEKKGYSVDAFMKAVNTSNYKVLPVIDFLNEKYPEIEKRYLKEMAVTRNRLKNNSRSHVFHLESGTFQQCKKTHVLLTYHGQDKKQMMWLASCLHKNGFAVSIDNQEELMKGSLSMEGQNLTRIQRIFDVVDYVLVLASPTYLRHVAGVGNLTVDASDPDVGCLYITKLMKARMATGGKRRERFVSVLVGGAGWGDVPGWMRPLRTYNWPADYRDLLFFIMDPESIVRRVAEMRGREVAEDGRANSVPCPRDSGGVRGGGRCELCCRSR